MSTPIVLSPDRGSAVEVYDAQGPGHMGGAGPLAQLREEDHAYRWLNEDAQTCALLEYYERRATDLVRRTNERLKVGPRDVPYTPIQSPLLPYSIRRQAVVYSRPPTRWLRNASGRLPGGDEQTTLMREVYAAALADEVFRRVDRYTNLTRVVLVRPYAAQGRLYLRTFLRNQVLRNPDPAFQTDVRMDLALALRLAHGEWEHWEQLSPDATSGQPRYRQTMLTERDGKVIASRVVGVFPVLPIVAWYDELTEECWPPLREDRLGAMEALNAMSNDLWAVTRSEVHSQTAFLNVHPEEVPRERGPGVDIAIDKAGADVKVLEHHPLIDSSQAVRDRSLGEFLTGEHCPPDDLDPRAVVVTGAGQKVRLHALTEHRQEAGAIFPRYETLTHEAVVFVWNAQAALGRLTGGKPATRMTVGLALELELSPLELPTEPLPNAQALGLLMEKGLLSRVEGIMRERGCGRDRAEVIAAQIDTDNEAFPLMGGAAVSTGQGQPAPDNPPTPSPEETPPGPQE